MTQGSSLPPLKKNDGKYILLALLILLLAGGLWFLSRGEEAAPEPELVEEPPSEPEPKPEDPPVLAELELPDEEELEPSRPAPRPSKKPSPVSASNPEDWNCHGVIGAAQARAVISGAPSKQVQTCYERRLKDNNLLQGSMNVSLKIGPSGSVRAVAVGGSLNDSQVYSCVKRAAKTWKFPKPDRGCAIVAVPFQMTPKL